jgi:hypothetical protein
MKLDLIDLWGDESTLYVRDTALPELTDELGRPVVDLSPFGRVHPSAPSSDDPSFKVLLDPFVVRPTSGLPVVWLNYPDSKLYEETARDLAQALYLLTGKLLLCVSK